MGRETLEPQELVEREAFEGRIRRGRVAVTAAILAVLASLSSLEGEHTLAESMLEKNDAVLWQSRASDEWAYRQAKSIKLHLQELAPGGASDAGQARSDITESEARAREDEQRRDEALHTSAERFEAHRRFAVGTSLFQIAIVMETLAAVLESTVLIGLGLVLGGIAALAFANGFLGFV
jgi:hypothetical protein